MKKNIRLTMNKLKKVVFYTVIGLILFTTSNVTYAQPDFFTGADMKFSFCYKSPDNVIFSNFFREGKIYVYTGFYRMHTNTNLNYFVSNGRESRLVTVDISNPEIAFGYGCEEGNGRLNLIVDQVFRFPIASIESYFRVNSFIGLKYNHELTRRIHLNASMGPRMDLFIERLELLDIRIGIQWNIGAEFTISNKLNLFAKAGSKHGYADFLSSNEAQVNIGLIYNIRNCNKQPKHRQKQQPRHRQINVPCPEQHRLRHWERTPSVFNRVGN